MPYTFDKAALRTEIVRGIEDGLTRVAIEFQRGMIRILSEKGLGPRAVKYYTGKGRVRKRRLMYARSTPGSPPAAQTGTLKRSWSAAKPRVYTGFGQSSVTIGTNLKYAPWLEYGTKTKSGGRKMLPRPSVRPVVESVRKRGLEIVNDRVAKRLARFAR